MDNKLIDAAEKLVSASQILAISSFKLFCNEIQPIRGVNTSDWDFFVTVAGVFVAVTQLNHENISLEDKDRLLALITDSCVKCYPNFVEACDDCRNFVDSTYNSLEETIADDEKKFLFSDCLGTWIIWNVIKEAPLRNKARPQIRALGGLLTHSFITWWK